jgi:Spy/CpxP family protein refolding chaperone
MKRTTPLSLKNFGIATIVLAALSAWIFSQTAEVRAKPLTDTDVQLLRQDIQSIKNQVISDTMNFNDKESAAFWPVYQRYSAAQRAIADKRLAIITDYAQNLDKMDDAKARDLTDRMFAIEDETQALQKQYFARFEQALGAKRTAKLYQVDNRLTQMVNLQLASEIPLIP